ncbi:MAG: hypothetical protein A2653_01695 [Candidatus Zambryskibacteria bacterium RIFCSPHIGHO2_01_FULL_43_25]|nr:MAG: hypothetical protein A2653_01695 [Candidatus Zambryskibacteria bacterium RIFCSPHIGHO2_01_FULL_43_25]
MKIHYQNLEKENGQLLKLSQAGRGSSGGTSCTSSDETTKFSENLVLLGEFCLRRSQFISELGLAWTHSLQTTFRFVQTRAQALDSLGYDMVVVGVLTKKLAVRRVLGARTAGVETSRAA